MKAEIIVADDHPTLREPLAAALTQNGYSVRMAKDGVEVLSLVDEEKPDLLVLDLAMPRMGGVVCLRNLRTAYTKEQLPVIVLSAHSEQETVSQVARLGINDFMLKASFSLSGLLSMVAEHLTHLSSDTPDASPAETVRRETSGSFASKSERKSPAAWMEQPTLESRLEPLIDRQEIDDRMKKLESVKAFSPAVTNLLRTIDHPRSTLDQIVDSASLDQALATKLLWLANSAAFARGEPVTSVRTAIVRIGTNRIREAALTLGILDRFGPHHEKVIHYGRFWEHSIAVAALASSIISSSPRLGHLDPDVAFTVGLIHDVGRLVLIEVLDEIYAEVLEVSQSTGKSLFAVEKAMLLTSHSKIGEKILRQWKFSSEIVFPVNFHHMRSGELVNLKAPGQLMTATLAIANNWAQAMLLGESGDDSIQDQPELLELLGITRENRTEIEHQIFESWRDLRTIVSMRSNTEWPEKTGLVREQFPEGIRPRIFRPAEAEGFSIYETLVSRLFPEVDENNFNSWMLFARTQVDAERRLDQVRLIESSAGLEALPVVVLSPESLSSDSFVPHQPDRVILSVQSPLHLKQLARCMKTLAA